MPKEALNITEAPRHTHISGLWQAKYVFVGNLFSIMLKENLCYNYTTSRTICVQNKHLVVANISYELHKKSLALQAFAALQYTCNLFCVYRYAFYHQFAIERCLVHWCRYQESKVIRVDRFCEAKSPVSPTVQRGAG